VDIIDELRTMLCFFHLILKNMKNYLTNMKLHSLTYEKHCKGKILNIPMVEWENCGFEQCHVFSFNFEKYEKLSYKYEITF
jgi:hypothetical protein